MSLLCSFDIAAEIARLMPVITWGKIEGITVGKTSSVPSLPKGKSFGITGLRLRRKYFLLFFTLLLAKKKIRLKDAGVQFFIYFIK